MPTYEYRCADCSAYLSVMRPITDVLETEPCLCGGVMRRIFSAPAVQFKGSGFYRTDK